MFGYNIRTLCCYVWVTIVIVACVLLRTEKRLMVNEENTLAGRPLTSNISHTLPSDGFPRVVIAGPCSGSSATMRFTRAILQAHGYDVPFGGEPILDKNPIILEAAKKRLEPKMDREPTISELVAEGIVYKTEMATKSQRIYLFKIKAVHNDILKTLKKLGAKFAYTYRGNVVDRAICTSRDCFGGGRLGHQVYENGTDANACFDRRGSIDEKLMANFNDTTVLMEVMKGWEKQNRIAERAYKSLYDPADIATYEDLFKFEYTDSEEVFSDCVQKWMAFLRTLLEIQQPILRNVLLPHKNSRPPPAPFKETVYNFEKIEGILSETHFKKYLSK